MRRRRAEKRVVLPDPKYKNIMVTRFINCIMTQGKKSKAEGIVYGAFEILAQKTGKPAIEVFQKALDNARPLLEIKPRRIGGARVKKGKPMEIKLADELLEAYNNQGSAVKKREDTHKMAEANKAFAHYRW
jgi:small subunit ribosomal protein S7